MDKWFARNAERGRCRDAVGSLKTGADNSMIPDNQDVTLCVRTQAEIRKKFSLANLWIVESCLNEWMDE